MLMRTVDWRGARRSGSTIRGGADEARIPLFGLAAFAAGALAGALRNLPDLHPSGRRAGYLAVLVILLGVASLLALETKALGRGKARTANA